MSKKLLICDDEEGVRESLKLILSDFYELITVEDGTQAQDVLKNSYQQIGLMLLDINIPKISGLDILKQFKEDYPELPIIIATGYKSTEMATEAVRLGACGYIIKPFKSEEILSVVRNKLG